MICGNTDGRCVLMSQPSGVPDGAGVIGQEPAPVEDDALELAEAEPVPAEPVPPVQAAITTTSAHSIAEREDRVMARSVAEVAGPGR
jgi:hypothetical protein